MERHKFFRDTFIELANKKFTEKDVFIRISYKDRKAKPIDTIKDTLRFLKMPFRDKERLWNLLRRSLTILKMVWMIRLTQGWWLRIARFSGFLWIGLGLAYQPWLWLFFIIIF